MTKPEILSEQPMAMFQVLEELKAIKKKEKELNFRANRTEEYLKQFAPLDSKKAEELVKKIQNLKISRLKDSHMYKIVDLMPKTVNDLKAILQGYTITIKAEDIKKIVELINEYSK